MKLKRKSERKKVFRISKYKLMILIKLLNLSSRKFNVLTGAIFYRKIMTLYVDDKVAYI